MGTTAFYEKRLESIVAETEPFFGAIMKVYLDLLCRGEREASRLLFRSGVRFAGAVHGMRRAAIRRGCLRDGQGDAGPDGGLRVPDASQVAEGADTGCPRAETSAGACAQARAAVAAKRHLERCLYALWTVQQRRADGRGALATGGGAADGVAAGANAAGANAAGSGPDTAPIFDRGFMLLAALREVGGQTETACREYTETTPS